MNITVITEKYYPEGGGAEVVTHEVVKWLLSKGYRIFIISGSPLSYESRGELDEVARGGGGYYTYISLSELRFQRKLSHWLLVPKLIARNRAFLDAISKSNLVYIPGISYTLIPLLRKLRGDNIRIVIHLHNFQPITYSQFYIETENGKQLRSIDMKLLQLEYGRISTIITPFISYLLKTLQNALEGSDKIICPSQTYKQIIERFVPTLKKLVVAYNPLPVTSNTPHSYSKKGRIMTYLGGKRFIKGYPIAEITARRIIKEVKDVKIYLVGFPQMRIENTKILYLPHIKRWKTLKLLTISRVLLFPSIIAEPSPISIIETILLGAIPVAFKHSTIQEILGGTKAQEFLCSPYDLKCVYEKAKHLLNIDVREFSEISYSVKRDFIAKFKNKEFLLVNLEKAIIE